MRILTGSLFALCFSKNREFVASAPPKYVNASFMPAKSRFVVCGAPVRIGAALRPGIIGQGRGRGLQDARWNTLCHPRRVVAGAVRRQQGTDRQMRGPDVRQKLWVMNNAGKLVLDINPKVMDLTGRLGIRKDFAYGSPVNHAGCEIYSLVQSNG